MKRFAITLAAIAAVTFGMTGTVMAGHGHHDDHGHHNNGHHNNGHHNDHHNHGHHNNHGYYYVRSVPTYRPAPAPIVVVNVPGHSDF